MASIRKRKWTHKGVEGEAWVLDYVDNAGKRRQKTFDKKKDADKERLRIESEVAAGIHVAASATIKVAEACDRFLDDCERRRRVGDRMTGETIRGYRGGIARQIKPAIGHKLLTDLTTDDVQAFYDKMMDTLSLRAARNRALILKLILDFACAKRWLRVNVAVDKAVKMPPMARDKRTLPSKEDLRKLLVAAAAQEVDHQALATVNRNLMVRLGMFGGLRVGEMFGLQWENVDFDSEILRIRHSVSRTDGLKGPKSECGVRDVPLTRPIYDALMDVLRFWQCWEDTRTLSASMAGLRRRLATAPAVDLDRPRAGFVLRSHKGAVDGKPLTPAASGDLWRGVMKKAGLVDSDDKPNFTLHDLRHVAASLFIEAGLPAFNLKTVIGHASVSTTYNVYGHIFPSDTRIKDTANAIAATMPAVPQIEFTRPGY